jgi:hypothetical protein
MNRPLMRRLAEAPWDVSVLGLTKSELDDMDDEERRDRCAEELNRAVDLLEAIPAAFTTTLDVNDRAKIHTYAERLKLMARSMRKIR